MGENRRNSAVRLTGRGVNRWLGSSFKRYLVRAETELRVVVEWEKGLGYLVSSWGLLSKGELMAHYHGGGFASVIKS